VTWRRGRREEIDDPDELERVLDVLTTEARTDGRPQAIDVTVGSNGTLTIIVGADRSMLSHVPADLDRRTWRASATKTALGSSSSTSTEATTRKHR
jgi:hypothetical protein